jgi:hypothetical protein
MIIEPATRLSESLKSGPAVPPRAVAGVILVILCAVLTFTALTVNKKQILNVGTNRFWGVCQIWEQNGFLNSYGLWLERINPAFYRQQGPPGLYAYANSDTGFLLPIYTVERALVIIRGRPSRALFQLYSQLVVLAGAFFLALLGMRIAMRRGHDLLFAGTAGLAAGVVFQNVMHNLDRAREIHHSTVFLTLLIVLLYVRERWWERLRDGSTGLSVLVAGLIFAMAISDHITNAGFLVLVIGVLAVYGQVPRMSLRRWSATYLAPVAVGFVIFQLQLWLARTHLGIDSIGSPVILRFGFGNTGFAHPQILSHLRPPWSWWGLASLAAVCLVAVLARRSESAEEDRRDLEPVFIPILVWTCLAAVFSEMVAVHPYLFDLFLIIPSVLLVFVHGPVLLARFYKNTGLIALAVLFGAFFYVWMSLTAYATYIASLSR